MWNNLYANIREALNQRPLIVAACSGVAAILLAGGYLREREAEILRAAEPVEVAVASRDVAPGSVITLDDVKTRRIPRRFVQPASLGRARDIAGRVAVVPFKAGAQFTAAAARHPWQAGELSPLVPAGRRAFAILLEEGKGAFVKPFDAVDVLATFDLGSESSVRRTTMTIVRNVQVLSVGSELADAPPATQGRSAGGLWGFDSSAAALSRGGLVVSLAVTPAEAQVLAFAEASGRIAIALRTRGDDAAEEPPQPTTMAGIASGHGDVVPMRRNYREYRGR